MEGLMYFVLGLVLLYPCIQYFRKGRHEMLRIPWIFLVILCVPAILFFDEAFSFATSGKSVSVSGGVLQSQVFFWWMGSVFILTYLVFMVFQLVKGISEGVAADWSSVQSRAEIAVADGNVAYAVKLYEEALRYDARDFRGHFKFAMFLLKSGYVKRGYEHFLLAIEHSPIEYRPDLANEAVDILESTPGGEAFSDKFIDICKRNLGLFR